MEAIQRAAPASNRLLIPARSPDTSLPNHIITVHDTTVLELTYQEFRSFASYLGASRRTSGTRDANELCSEQQRLKSTSTPVPIGCGRMRTRSSGDQYRFRADCMDSNRGRCYSHHAWHASTGLRTAQRAECAGLRAQRERSTLWFVKW